jgi:hypothetical protein
VWSIRWAIQKGHSTEHQCWYQPSHGKVLTRKGPCLASHGMLGLLVYCVTSAAGLRVPGHAYVMHLALPSAIICRYSPHLLPGSWVISHPQLLQDEADVLAVMTPEPAAAAAAAAAEVRVTCSGPMSRPCELTPCWQAQCTRLLLSLFLPGRCASVKDARTPLLHQQGCRSAVKCPEPWKQPPLPNAGMLSSAPWQIHTDRFCRLNITKSSAPASHLWSRHWQVRFSSRSVTV